MKTLQLVRDLVSPIADINFLISIDSLESDYSDSQIAKIINGINFDKAETKFYQFKEKCDRKLSELEFRVSGKKEELKSAERNVSISQPGYEPSKPIFGRDDPDKIARYNAEVRAYNNRLEAYERAIDKKDRAQELYEDAFEKYQDKKAEYEQQIEEKAEELKPALELDIIAFLSKLQQLVYDSIHNKEYFIEALILIFMAKKAYIFLFDRLDNPANMKAASEIFKQLETELEQMIETHKTKVQQGLIDIVSYLHDGFKINESILSDIDEKRKRLPYAECEENEPEANRLVSVAVDSFFNYQDIINPIELAQIELQVHERKSNFEQYIQTISDFADSINDHFIIIDDVKTYCNNNFDRMLDNKQHRMGEAFFDALFTLRVFDENEQDEFLKKQKQWLIETQKEIEELLKIDLLELVDTIVSTELLTKSTAEIIAQDGGFNFLNYQNQLALKKQELIQGVSTLDSTIEAINRLPEEKAQLFNQEINKYLGLSLLPIANLAILTPIHKQIITFLPAFKSKNTIYNELKKNSIKKLQIFFYIHLSLIFLSGVLSIPLKNKEVKPLLYFLSSTYGISSLVLFFKKRKLKSLNNYDK